MAIRRLWGAYVDEPVVVIVPKLKDEMVAFAKRLRSKGLLIVEGSCSSAEILKRYNVESAKEIVITQPVSTKQGVSDLNVAQTACLIAGINSHGRIIVEIESHKYMPFLRDIGVSDFIARLK